MNLLIELNNKFTWEVLEFLKRFDDDLLEFLKRFDDELLEFLKRFDDNLLALLQKFDNEEFLAFLKSLLDLESGFSEEVRNVILSLIQNGDIVLGGDVEEHNVSPESHEDIRQLITELAGNSETVDAHNSDIHAHPDIRLLIQELLETVNGLTTKVHTLEEQIEFILENGVGGGGCECPTFIFGTEELIPNEAPLDEDTVYFQYE